MKTLTKLMRNSEGAILITVMLTMAIMAAVAVSILDNIGLSVRMTRNSTSYNQARWYALATEPWALENIKKSKRQIEIESDIVPSVFQNTHVSIESAEIRGRLGPLANCFNLNSLVEPDASGALVLHVPSALQFQRLLIALEISEGTATQLTASLVDWIDSDSELQLNGAEDYDYSGLKFPHRTGNVFLAHKSELRAIKGFTRETYETIEPLVCALPTNVPNAINLNVLTESQHPLLAMVYGTHTAATVTEAILFARPKGGFIDIQGALSLPVVANAEDGAEAKGLLSIKSKYFQLQTEVELENSYVELKTLFDSEKVGNASFVRRRFGGEN